MGDAKARAPKRKQKKGKKLEGETTPAAASSVPKKNGARK